MEEKIRQIVREELENHSAKAEKEAINYLTDSLSTFSLKKGEEELYALYKNIEDIKRLKSTAKALLYSFGFFLTITLIIVRIAYSDFFSLSISSNLKVILAFYLSFCIVFAFLSALSLYLTLDRLKI